MLLSGSCSSSSLLLLLLSLSAALPLLLLLLLRELFAVAQPVPVLLSYPSRCTDPGTPFKPRRFAVASRATSDDEVFSSLGDSSSLLLLVPLLLYVEEALLLLLPLLPLSWPHSPADSSSDKSASPSSPSASSVHACRVQTYPVGSCVGSSEHMYAQKIRPSPHTQSIGSCMTT
jgi:hypothetical protein